MRCRNSECPLHRGDQCGFVREGRRRDVPVLVAYLQRPDRQSDCPLLERLRIAGAQQSLDSGQAAAPFELLAALGRFRTDEESLRTLRQLGQALSSAVLVRRQSQRAPQQHCGTCRSFGPYSRLCLRIYSSDPLSARLGPHAHFGAALAADQDPSGLFPPCRSHDPLPNEVIEAREVEAHSWDRAPLLEALLALAAEDPLGARLFDAVVLQSESLADLAEALGVELGEAHEALARAAERWRGLTANLFRHETAS